MMTRMLLLITTVLLGGLAQAKAPNVVFFLVDDLGQRDVGCYGSTFHETPAIDQLAKEGILFNNAYSTCHVCSPSRASILTGKYPARINLTEWLGGRPERDYEPLHHAEKLTALQAEEITLAETLKGHGYATANYGKAHVRMDPTTYGFDEEITGWVRSYHYPFGGAYDKKLPAKEGDYYTDKLTDAALDFIERNKDQPFFVHLEHFAVHDPIQGRPDLVEKYRKKLAAMQKLPEQEGPDFILEPNPDGPPLTEKELNALAENDQQQAQRDARVWWVKQKQDNVEFAGMLEATDESLARIRAKLKELGLEKNTIIIFTSDNGGMSASNGYRSNATREALDARFASSNLPLRGAKGWNYEGGVRVPLIVHWPGRTEPNTTSEAIVTGTDYYPTLLEMMNLPAVPDQHVDGKSFVPALNGDAYERGPIYWHFPHYSNHGYQSPGGAIRSGDFKLLEYYENGTVQLFDLANDIGERNDLAKERPEVVARLKKQFKDWRDEVDAKMPYPKTATSKPAPGARVIAPPAKAKGKGSGAGIVSKDLPKQVAQFAPGWKVKDWGGPGMKPGLRKEWGGRKNVLLTHPLSRDTPCVLSRSVKIPAGKKTALKIAVNNHPKANWTLVVRIDGDDVVQKSIEASAWQAFQFDLTKHAGETINIELENRASGWASEAAYWSGIKVESSVQTRKPFTIAVLPDTQFYCDTRLKLSAKWGNGDLRRYFFKQTEWVRDNQERLNIAYLVHEGDLVQADAPEEWAIAKKAMSVLDGNVPYSMCLGNHDMGFEKADNKYGGNIGVNRTTLFNTYFPREKFAKRREFGGTFDPDRHDNSWYHFEEAGMKFLIVSLECKPRDEVLDWANNIVSKNPDHRVIVLTHAYLTPKKSRNTGGGVKPKGNTGEQMWQKFVKKHKNIFMVLCGHHTGEAVRTDAGDHGNPVHQILCDYQGLHNGGESWLRYMTFKPEANKISIHTYNPALDKFKKGPSSRFDLDYPMANTATGAPGVPRPGATNDVKKADVAGPSIKAAFASVQRNGEPYKTFYNNYIAPHAVIENDIVFTAHQDGQGRPVIDAYDIKKKTWIGPVRASDFGLGRDTHGNPSLTIDSKGHVHVFFGCHGGEMKHVRSTVPYNISRWKEMPAPTPRATYPQTMRMADGSIYLFYRAGGHLAPWSLRISKDDGESWSKSEPMIDMRRDFPDKKACSYNAFVPGADYKTVHCFWVYKDDDPRGNKRKYQGMHEAVYRYNMYYAKRTADGKWIAADGTPMSDLPANKTFCDEHAMFLNSGEEFTAPKRIVIDRNDTPYIHIRQGVTDWKRGKVFVPDHYRFASPLSGNWRVHDEMPNQWPDLVKRLLLSAGPAAFGGSQPNRWFIHYKEGPPEDVAATYVWLGHLEKGYAIRKTGPARSPER